MIGLFVFVVCLIILLVLAYILVTSECYPAVLRYDEENFFFDPITKSKIPFPSLYESPSVKLSVIIPAYNEEERLPRMLEECLKYLEDVSHLGNESSYEVIIVDDGSKDKTTEVALNYSKKFGCDKVRVLSLTKNRGKGGAVRLGVLSSRGRQLLFADADGATTFEDITKLQLSLERITEGDQSGNSQGLVCGSRAHLEEEAIASRSLIRTFLMKGFHFLVWLLAARSIRDTQCGFKLLTRSTARLCFPNLHIEKWAFDVELIYIAEHFKVPLDEVAVRWTEIEGSKIVPVLSWLQMGRDLVLLWLRYTTGAWKLRIEGNY
nr:EOG090X0BIY [Macrothrix elegans]